MVFYRVKHSKTVFHIMFGGRGKRIGKSSELVSALARCRYLSREKIHLNLPELRY